LSYKLHLFPDVPTVSVSRAGHGAGEGSTNETHDDTDRRIDDGGPDTERRRRRRG